MRLNDLHKFYVAHYSEVEDIARGIQMDGISSLDFSSSTSAETIYCQCHFLRALSCLLPYLREIDIFNTGLEGGTLPMLSKNCPLLDKITWNNKNKDAYILLNGIYMSSFDNVKEIYMDNSVFYSFEGETERMLDLNNPALNTGFIFHYCCKKLGRVSIRNAKWYIYGSEPTRIPQNALIKFVRSVPSLRWFRSDLTRENMNMLQLERPEIELLN
jgi:hypothetical protein